MQKGVSFKGGGCDHQLAVSWMHYPVGPKRHPDAARQNFHKTILPLNCRAITLTTRANFEEIKRTLLRRRHLRDSLGERSGESKIASRQWEVNVCRRACRCLTGPPGQNQLHNSASPAPPSQTPPCENSSKFEFLII